MPLLKFWESERDEVLKMTVEQVISSAGDGNLRDSGECSEELRTFLKAVPSDLQFAYARHCLENKFDKSGFGLQNILNELGRRLDFDWKTVSTRVSVTPSVLTEFGAPKELRVCCAVSKRYEGDYQPYWCAYRPKWDEFLSEGKEGFFIILCMDRDEAFAVPYSWIQKNKKNLNTTTRATSRIGMFRSQPSMAESWRSTHRRSAARQHWDRIGMR